MKYILFLDESGDMGIKGSDFFIITILAIKSNNLRKLTHIDNRVRRNKFKKELKRKKEIKGSTSSEDLIFYLIKRLNEMDYTAYSIVMNKNNFRNKDL